MKYKQNTWILAILAFFITAVFASAATTYATTNPMPNHYPNTTTGPVLGEGWNVNAFASYVNPDNGFDDAYGCGLAAEYYFDKYFGTGVSAEYANTEIDPGWAFMGTATLRYPVTDNFAPYVTFQGGVQTAAETEALFRAGAGVQFKFTENVGMFADWMYGWSSGSQEHQIVRLGLSYSF